MTAVQKFIDNKMITEKKEVNVIAVLPIGPNDPGMDTIESIFLYMNESVHIIAIDDSKNPTTRERLQKLGDRITILEPVGQGLRGGLWTSLASAYKYAVENFNFKMLLRIDTDALVIDFGLEDDVEAAFRNDSKIGMLGSYKIDCNGDKNSFLISMNTIWRESGIRGIVRPRRRKLLRSWLKLARKGGYHLGQYILGGANFQSYASVKAMAEAGYLDTDLFLDSGVGEDYLFTILTFACGFKGADFVTGDFPMGLRWQGLPDSPENLVKRKKKIIHSIKFWEDMDQTSIRAFFAEKRAKDAAIK